MRRVIPAAAAAAAAAGGGRRIHYSGLSHVARITITAILLPRFLLCCCAGWFHCEEEGEAAKLVLRLNVFLVCEFAWNE